MKLRILSTARLSLPLASALAALVAAQSASATAIWWDGGIGNWGTTVATATSWSTVAGAATPNPTAVVGASDDLTFNRTGINTNNIITLAANQAANSLTFNSTGTSIFRANASGTTTLRTLTVGSGGITIASGAGAVTIGDTPGTYGVIDINLAASQIWTNNSANTFTFGGAVTGGAVNLTKSGTATIRLNGANTYSGTTTVNNGILQIGNYSGLSNTSSITVSGGGTSNLQLVQVGTGTTTNSINKALSLHGTLSTAGGSSSNRLNLTWGGDITLAGASTINNNGNSLFDINGQVDLGANALTYQADGTGSRIDGNIIGTGGSLIKTSNQDLLLTGTNSYTGGTTISLGRLQFAKLLAMPATGAVAVNASTLAVNVGGTGEWTTGTSGYGTIGGLLAGLGGQTGSTVSWSGVSTLGLDTANASPTTQTYSGVIGDVGTSLGITKLGANTLTLDQANTYSGATTVSGGTLRISNTSASTAVSVGSGTTLDLAADTVFASSTPLTVTGGTIASGRTSSSAGGTHAFGTMAVSNATQNFTAGTNATGTTAAIQVASITNASGANGSVTLNPTTANLIVVGGYTSPANAGVNNLILGGTSLGNSIGGAISNGTRLTQNLIKSNTSIWTLGDSNTHNGLNQIQQGVLVVTKVGNTGDTSSSLGTMVNLASPVGATATVTQLNIGNAGTTGTLRFTGATQDTSRQVQVGTNTATPVVTDTGGATIEANGASNAALTFTNSTFNVQTNASTGVGADRVLTLTGASTGLNTISGIIQNNLVSGTGTGTAKVSLTKDGAGTWVLGGTNTYTGATTVSQGTLEVTVNNALGTGVGALGTSVTAGAALKLTGVNYSTAEALSINGSGILGGGALVNSGASTYAGQITAATNASINGGGIGATLHLTGGLVKDGTVLTLTGGGTIHVDSVISGASAGSDLVVDATTVQLSGINTYNGPTYIRNAGKIEMLSTGVLPSATALILDDTGSGSSTFEIKSTSGNQTIASLSGAASSAVILDNKHLTVGDATSTTYAGTITGGNTSEFIKEGAGTLTLSGNSSAGYTGHTKVNVGTLLVNGNISGSHTTEVAATATLGGNGTVGVLKINSGGILAPGASASVDIQTLNAAGDTTWNGGSVWQFDLGAASGSADKLAINGAFTKAGVGAYQFDFMGSAPAAWGNIYDLVTFTSTTFNPLTDFTFTGLTGSYTNGTFAITGGNTLQFTAIPEPTSALAGLLLGAGLLRRRRTGQGRVSDASGA